MTTSFAFQAFNSFHPFFQMLGKKVQAPTNHHRPIHPSSHQFSFCFGPIGYNAPPHPTNPPILIQNYHPILLVSSPPGSFPSPQASLIHFWSADTFCVLPGSERLRACLLACLQSLVGFLEFFVVFVGVQKLQDQ